MSWIYVTEAGARLYKKGGRYVISREKEVLCEIPAAAVEGAAVMDHVQVSAAVLVDFLQRGLPFTWLSSRGEYYGRLESTMHQDVLRQQKQFALREDKEFSMALSRIVIFDKIYNQMTVLRRYNRTARSDSIEQSIRNIRAVADKLHQAENTEDIMGYEGIIARCYFQALGSIVPETFRFGKRTRQPPKDPFNSLLSFGYTLLMYDFYTAITQVGLHPYVGFLHALRNGHPALASDLMEPWRPAVVDSMCLSLVSRKEIRPEHFQTSETNGGVYLDRVGRRIFLKSYEKRMQAGSKYFGGTYSWRYTILMQLRSFSLAMEKKEISLFKPLVIR